MSQPQQDQSRRPLSGIGGIGWALMVLAGWLLFELTAEPALAATVTCSKLGWDDFLTARWLKRKDSSRSRGRAMAWFYCGYGLAKIFVTAFFVMVPLVIIEVNAMMEQPGVQPKRWSPGASLLVEAIVGMLLFSATTLIALYLAWRAGVRVWLQGGLRGARRDNEWPPLLYCRRNVADGMIRSAFTVFTLVILFSSLIAHSVLISWQPQRRPLALSAAILLLITGLAAMGWIEIARKAVVAATPDKCWTDAFPPKER